MLAKILVTMSAWFLLSVIVGLLVGRAISTFREAPAPGFTPPLAETDWGAAALNELEEEMLVLAHAQMEEVRPVNRNSGYIVPIKLLPNDKGPRHL
jgi:hypothetical protein